MRGLMIKGLAAALVALPLAYFASSTYLNFFADRISAPAGIVAASGVLAVVFAPVFPMDQPTNLAILRKKTAHTSMI